MNIQDLKGKSVKIFTATALEFATVKQIAQLNGWTCIDRSTFQQANSRGAAGIWLTRDNTIVVSSAPNSNTYDYAMPADMFLSWVNEKK